MMEWLRDNLAYNTPKYVSLRDWKLAVINYSVKFFIFLYIVLYTMVYNCKHLKPVPILGVARATIQHPTVDCNPLRPGCAPDFTPFAELPYCHEHELSSGRDAGVARVDIRRPCANRDMFDMKPSVPTPEFMFVHTRCSEVQQRRAPGAPSPWVTDDSGGVQAHYVADIERFTLLLGHSWQTVASKGHTRTGWAADSQGFISAQRPSGRPARGSVRDILGDHARLPRHPIPAFRPDPASAFPSVLSADAGDLISLADLLVAADPAGALDAVRRSDEGYDDLNTLRWRGGVLVVDVEYDNLAKLDPFGLAPITYDISANFLPVTEYKHMFATLNDDGSRQIHVRHGLLILFRVAGSIKTLDAQYLLLVCTTALGLLAVSGLVVDTAMCYLPAFSGKYRALKYQRSQHFGKLSLLTKVSPSAAGAGVGAAYEPLTPTALQSREVSSLMPHAHLLEAHLPGPEHEEGKALTTTELLTLLSKFQQRLNAIDGMDEPVGPGGSNAIAEFLDRQEASHLEAAFKANGAPVPSNVAQAFRV